jgi:hypothetical protein
LVRGLAEDVAAAISAGGRLGSEAGVILTVRGEKVLLDGDLARIYGV